MSLDHAKTIVKHQKPTRDAFLDGRLTIAQPESGFRAGLDSVLLGAAVGAATGTVLDLGAGVGTAALVALSHATELQATLAESDPAMLALAASNIAENGFGRRAETLSLDVTAAGDTRRSAGLLVDAYGAVIANPPFFERGRGTVSPVRPRAAARHRAADDLDLWVRTAASAVAPGGEVIFILPAAGMVALLAAFDRRFGALTLLPVAPRPDQPASRVLLRGIKGSRAPLSLLPALAVHGPQGRGFTPGMEALLRGAARLVW